MNCCSRVLILVFLLFIINHSFAQDTHVREKLRVIVTSDGEIDDECSLVRFLLYANEWDIEGIVTSSSQYHSHGSRIRLFRPISAPLGEIWYSHHYLRSVRGDCLPGEKVKLSAEGTSDPDGDELDYHWWQYLEAGSYHDRIEIREANDQVASLVVPGDAGIPQLTRYQRLVIKIK